MDEINRESETDVITIIISYLLMFVYITIFLGHVRSIKTICVSFVENESKNVLFPGVLSLVDTFGTSHFVLYREVVLCSVVKMY